MEANCQHEEVIVNVLGRWGNRSDVSVTVLQQEQSPLQMTLTCPRCGICGTSLGWRQLKTRIKPKGDLFDHRFIWSSIKPRWMFWRSGSNFNERN